MSSYLPEDMDVILLEPYNGAVNIEPQFWPVKVHFWSHYILEPEHVDSRKELSVFILSSVSNPDTTCCQHNLLK